MTATAWTYAFGEPVAARLGPALADWLPTRRWFGSGGRRPEQVEVVRAVELTDHGRHGGPRGLLVVVAVHLGDTVGHFQLLLGLRPDDSPTWLGGELVLHAGGTLVYDGTADPELMSALLRLIADGARVGELRFVPERPADLRLARRAGLRVRRGSAEQSNTSVVFGDRFILKLFRRLSPGVNPDLEVHRRLAGGAHLARLVGAVEGELHGQPVTFGVLHSFVPRAREGWDLVTTGVRALLDGEPEPVDLLPELSELGSAVAAVHTQLADAFGTAEVTGPALAAARSRMHDRLTAAARDAPVLLPHLPALRRVLDRLPAGPTERAQRVHGDLHLGQVLRTTDGWLLIDFEGEPAAPIGDRVTRRSPLQDVAGMLRSLEYAAGHALLAGGAPEDPGRQRVARQWVTAARDAFCAGYTAAGGVPLGDRAGLDAYELDKAVYEVVYETRNRPGWVDIPLRAVRRFAAAQPDADSGPAEMPTGHTGDIAK
ncbi:aminoglycoside phosphotransferase [Micromonospora sp. NPDC049171]|uniref:maltokinase N-terminal cap-like domain-containing protein n=1 Tax=Micromonospora sp. NPDC049171 TaxID=3155770 RepID=UPI00340239EC